ncbi:MAG: alpha/beta hydrolase [Pseudomonadota bacterium]
MQETVLIVPGFGGSGEAHWQSWFERQLPDARRVTGIDWDVPALTRWSDAIAREIARASGPVWLVAHSFGCLASARAVLHNGDKVAGALLVAPADPQRFSLFGPKELAVAGGDLDDSIARLLPQKSLGFPSVVIASSNDPWITIPVAMSWAKRWGSHFINAGNAGHINIDSGFGAWALGLSFFQSLRFLARGDAGRRLARGEQEQPLSKSAEV